jgi:hypothetical protein
VDGGGHRAELAEIELQGERTNRTGLSATLATLSETTRMPSMSALF